MTVLYACVPALVLLCCAVETYRYLKENFLEEWYTEISPNRRTGNPEHIQRCRPKWWFTAQDKHSRLVARGIASLTALLLSITVWLKLAVGEPDLPGIFSPWWVLITFGLSALSAYASWKASRHYKELLHWQFDAAMLFLSISLPLAANALLFAIIHMAA